VIVNFEDDSSYPSEEKPMKTDAKPMKVDANLQVLLSPPSRTHRCALHQEKVKGG
jgi:hypothetical protein